MPLISIPKNYLDGDVYFESDVDDIRDGIVDFLNVDRIDDVNIQNEGITGSDKLVDASVSTAKIADEAVTEPKIQLESRYMPIGSITMFHTFNGAVSIPRGWMQCNGDVVNATNYDAIHSSGDFVTDGVGSAALNAKNLPSMISKYPVGVASTTQDGSVAITSVGNSSNQIDIEHSHTVNAHNHQWYDFNGAGDHNSYDGAGSLLSINTSLGTTSNAGIEASTASVSKLGTDFFTDNQTPGTNNSLSSTQSIQPESLEVIYIIKVV